MPHDPVNDDRDEALAGGVHDPAAGFDDLADLIHDAPAASPAPYGECVRCGEPLDRDAGRLCLACELDA